MQIERAVSSHRDNEGNPAHVVDIRIPIKKPHGTLDVVGLFDVHADSSDCCGTQLKKDLRALTGRNCRIIVGGDWNNMIFARDPRFVASGLARFLRGADDPADAVVDYNESLLAPLADKIDLFISGNHEEEYAKRHGTNVAKQTAKRLGVPYFSYYALIRYFMDYKTGQGRISRGWVHHGFGGNAPVTRGMIPLTRVASQNRFDWIMLGHLHQRTFSETTCLDDGGGYGKGKLREIPIAAAQCGTYSRNFASETASWSAQKGHPPARLGYATMHLDWDKTEHDGMTITPRLN